MGDKLTDIATRRDDQAGLEIAGAKHIIDVDGVLCRIGLKHNTRPLPVVPECNVGAELPEELQSSFPGGAGEPAAPPRRALG